jgi:radical SAM superfamily enzyme YgiQ (UPF0313 family)
MPRLVFLAVNASYSHTSLAAWRLRGTVDPALWDWSTVETAIADSRDDVLARVLALRPDVLAVTFYLFNREWLTAFLARFRLLSPGTCVIGGGPEWLGESSGFFAPVPLVDCGIRGEGEMAFRQWLAVWDKRDQWSVIPGLVQAVDGRLADSGAEAERPESADIPLVGKIVLQGFDKPFVQLETSRGCGGACLFCTSGRGGGVRNFPPDRVRAELAAIRAAGVRDVRVLDRTFNEDEERCLAMLALFREQCPDTRFHLEIDPARVSEAMTAELRRFKPGCLHIEAGVQSLDEEVLRRSGRRGSPAEILQGLKRLSGVFGLPVHVDLIAGLPGSTWENVKQDLTLLTLLGVDEIQLELLKLLPGTRMEAMRESLGLAASPVPPYEVLKTPTFSPEGLWRVARMSRVVDGFHNQRDLRALARKACMMTSDFWPALTDYVFEQGSIREGLSLRNRFRIFKLFLSGRCPVLVPELVDAWYRGDHGLDEELAPARMWRGDVPPGARLLEGEAGQADRMVAVQGTPARYYAFKVEADGRRRLTAVYQGAA